MRTLVLGGAGMLGKAVVADGRRRGRAVLGLGRVHADVTERAQLLRWVDEYRPELIINCAAFTLVDECETRREEALAVNGEALENITAAAGHAGADLVHVSTDYVFNGSATAPIPEDAPTDPQSVYGLSKLRGEELALRYDRALVVRASWLFGPGGPNFAATIRRLIGQGTNPLRVVDDQIGRPTFTPFLARALWDLAEAKARGVVHYGNRERTSWHGFASEIAHILAPEVKVLPVSTREFPRPAPRPNYSVLDVSRFEQITSRRVEPWLSGLVAYLESRA
ncbi:MAG: dTDP-4-dehydrorhamnose reductase [Thermoanaerobaculia bacterium]|nr:dTDP-4-dehydrorhamnose reductase [Thermoanaerobaculia bacterium]